jgi:glycosyltransferase involved in cell wall biosynthesis
MISILMPVYNGIEFINESVTSVISQSFNEWELIIGINGHDKDSNVFKIAKKYENVDNRIKVYDLFNIKGKSNALNKMIEFCKYDFIALLDVDDIWHHKKLEIQTKFINYYDVIGSNCIWFGDINGIVPKIPQYDFSKFDFATVNPIINSSAIIKKELCYWKDEFNGIEDYDLWIRLRKLKKKFYNCPEILVKHRIHQNSAFNSKGNNCKVTPLLESHGLKRNTPQNNKPAVDMSATNFKVSLPNNHNIKLNY